jgi:hypothetical protein
MIKTKNRLLKENLLNAGEIFVSFLKSHLITLADFFGVIDRRLFVPEKPFKCTRIRCQ